MFNITHIKWIFNKFFFVFFSADGKMVKKDGDGAGNKMDTEQTHTK